MVRRDYTKATDTMNSTQYRQARHTEFRIAMDAYYAVARNNDATTEELTAAANARTWADREWINAQHIANQMAQAELDAATAKGCEEVVEVVSAEVATEATTAQTAETTEATIAQTAAEVKAAVESIVYTLNADGHLVANTAWGADGQVLSYAETVEAIAKGDGWFDREGRWVNKAGWEKQHAGLGAWLIAKLAE